MAKLTKRFIDALKPTERDVIHWDDTLRGFGLRQKPSGALAFVVQYRNVSGQSKRMTLGAFGVLTPQQARDLAAERLGDVRRGIDVADARQAKRKEMTFAEFCSRYMHDAHDGLVLTRSGQPKRPSTLEIDQGRIAGHLVPLLGPTLMSEIKRADIAAAMADISRGKTATDRHSGNLRGRTRITGGAGTAARTLGLLSGIFAHALELGIVEGNPCTGVKRRADDKRSVGNPDRLYAALGRALDVAEKNDEPWQAIEILRLGALTGMRRQELVRLTWAQVDIDGGVLRLTGTKTGRSNRPLSQAAASCLSRIRLRDLDGEYVFPAVRSRGTFFGGLPGAIGRIKTASALDDAERETLGDFHVHILRHALATTADALGFHGTTVAAFLGHAAGGVTNRYISQTDAVLRAAADQVGAEIDRKMRPPVSSVVDFRPRKTPAI